MRVLIAPLNWGLGHAARCIPLVENYLAQGAEVVLGGDGDSLVLLRRRFPDLRVLAFAPLRLRYSAGNSQVWAMCRALPRLLRSAMLDHRLLRERLEIEHFDLIISDNRFGLFTRDARCVYITHQLTIRLPHLWRWLEPSARAMHACVCRRYSEVWVPDYAEDGLSGELGHKAATGLRIRYIGPLTRFRNIPPVADSPYSRYDIVILLSGLEPQRTLLEQQLLTRYDGTSWSVLLVQGLASKPMTVIRHHGLTVVPHLNDTDLAAALRGAEHIVARSGYSTIMDFAALGVLDKAELIPTPGQPEQEYLAQLHAAKTNVRTDMTPARTNEK